MPKRGASFAPREGRTPLAGSARELVTFRMMGGCFAHHEGRTLLAGSARELVTFRMMGGCLPIMRSARPWQGALVGSW